MNAHTERTGDGTGNAPRILVVGAGGIGGVLAGTLLAAGQRVEVLCRGGATADAIEAHGFRLRGVNTPADVPGGAGVVIRRPEDAQGAGLQGPLRGPSPSQPSCSGSPQRATGVYDYILLATQPTDVEQAARQTVQLLAPEGRMVCLQNGLCELRVAEIVGRERTLGAVVSWGASSLEPGVYERTSAGGFSLGALAGPVEPAVERLAEILRAVGPVKITENLLGARWSKLAINCAISSLGTLGRDRLGVLMRRRFVRRLTLEVMSEVVAVARKEGVQLEVVSGTLDLEWLALTERERRARVSIGLLAKHSVLLAVGARYRRLRSSMLRAIERGQPPAVDFLNGEVVARAGDVPTPINAEVQASIHRLASGEIKGGIDDLRALFDRTRSLVRGGLVSAGS